MQDTEKLDVDQMLVSCPDSSYHCWCLLFSVPDCPNLPPPTHFGGPKNETKFLLDRRKSKKCKIGSPKKRFRGARKVAPRMDILRLKPKDRVLARDVASMHVKF